MKKLLTFATIAMIGVAAHAATVGWNITTGSTTYGNDAYRFFVIGQNGTESIATITTLLDAGSSVDSYAFGSGTTLANGGANVTGAASGKSLDVGTYTGFFVLFDSASPTAGSSQYVVVSGANTLTKEIGGSTATVSFTTGNANSIVSNSENWKAFGAATPTPGPSDVPEPTSGLLMLLGVAGLALKRKRA